MNNQHEELVKMLAFEMKKVYTAVPKKRNLDHLQGWREVAEYVLKELKSD